MIIILTVTRITTILTILLIHYIVA